MKLTGRHVLVTGASRGIGATLVANFTREGALVTAVARSSPALDAIAETSGARVLAADLAQPEHVAELIARTEDGHGPIDVLANNAAIAEVGTFATCDAESVRRHLQLNLLTPMELTRQVLPGMLERGIGTVAMNSSMAGEIGFPSICSYAASKAGLTRFAENLRRDLAATPVHVFLAVLGEVDTSMMDGSRHDAAFMAVVDRFPAKAMSADSVAAAIVGGIAGDRDAVVLPRVIRPAYALRQIPSRAVDMVAAPRPQLRPRAWLKRIRSARRSEA